jgi:hypothetical protein
LAYARAVSFEREAVVGLLAGAAILLLGCGKAATPTAQIRGNFAQLVAAFRQHDAHVICELLFPFGEHQPASALPTDLKQLSTASGQAGYQKYVDGCAPSFARDPRNFSAYERAFNGVSLGPIKIRGSIATVLAHAPGRRPFRIRFVKAAGEWRLLDGVQ